MSEQLYIRQRRRELLITLAYTIFSILMIIVTTVEQWPVFYVPFISVQIAFVWWSYIRSFQNYMIRAFLVTGMICVNIFLYGIQAENFAVLIPTLCVEFVLLSLYEITQVINITVLQTILLFLYQAIINDGFVIPDSTLERSRLMLHMLSLVVLICLCIYRIHHHIQEEDDFVDLEKRIEVEHKIKDDFMANTSHELRTPINTISGMCEILLQKDLPDEVRSNVLDIQMTGIELQNIVTDIMDYADLEADTMELSPRVYSITSTLNEVMNRSGFENRDKNLEMIFDCDPNIPRLLEGDDLQLRRVMDNLINNAIKFTSEGGVVVRVSHRPEDYGINLIVSVEDTGTGISLEEQETILRGFYQTDSERNSKRAGLGLGLTISSALVRKMGGFLTVRSKVGEGSEFTVTIPQRVIDEKPCISLNSSGAKKIIWYCRSKSDVSEIRDSFANHIRRFSDYFGLVSQQTSSLDECKRRVAGSKDAYLVIGQSEYAEDREYFDSLSKRMHVILIADREGGFEADEHMHVLYRPCNDIGLAEILNGAPTRSREQREGIRMFTAPTAKVMVVDDNLMNLKVAEGMLQRYGLEVVTATSGIEALKLVDSADYDFVFMDHMMPGMDGVECFHRIRAKEGEYFSNLPVIALTANAIAGAREMFISEGFDAFIAKPVDSKIMYETLKHFIPIEKQRYDADNGKRDRVTDDMRR